MERKIRELATELRRMPPSEGSEWLVKRFPLESEQWGQAMILLDHASFPKKEAKQLATYYLSGAPYASDRPYRVFAKLLGLNGLLKVLSDMLPQLQSESDLLLYNLRPLLDGACNEADRQAASAFRIAIGHTERPIVVESGHQRPSRYAIANRLLSDPGGLPPPANLPRV